MSTLDFNCESAHLSDEHFPFPESARSSDATARVTGSRYDTLRVYVEDLSLGTEPELLGICSSGKEAAQSLFDHMAEMAGMKETAVPLTNEPPFPGSHGQYQYTIEREYDHAGLPIIGGVDWKGATHHRQDLRFRNNYLFDLLVQCADAEDNPSDYSVRKYGVSTERGSTVSAKRKVVNLTTQVDHPDDRGSIKYKENNTVGVRFVSSKLDGYKGLEWLLSQTSDGAAKDEIREAWQRSLRRSRDAEMLDA